MTMEAIMSAKRKGVHIWDAGDYSLDANGKKTNTRHRRGDAVLFLHDAQRLGKSGSSAQTSATREINYKYRNKNGRTDPEVGWALLPAIRDC